MQIATIMLALGGDVGNTVPKYEVTPSEVAVLQLIHGNESVTEIDVYDKTVARTSRAERERLMANYGKPHPNGTFRCEPLDNLFPGVAARLFETFDELDIDDQFFKPKPQKAADPAPAPDKEAEEVGAVDYSKMTKVQLITLAEKRGVTVSSDDKKDALIDALETADLQAAQDAEDEGDDEIGDIPGGKKSLFE